MNSTLVGLSLANVLGKSPLFSYSHSTKISFHLFKNLELSRFSSKFLSGRSNLIVGITKSQFSNFTGGGIRISSDDQYHGVDGNTDPGITQNNGKLELSYSYFRYFDTDEDDSTQAKSHVIYSSVYTKITNCIFYEIWCGTEGSIATVAQSRAVQFRDKENEYTYQLFNVDCSLIDDSIYQIIQCEDYSNTPSCLIAKCGFDKLVGNQPQVQSTGWAFSITSADAQMNECTWTRIFGSKEHMDDSQYFIAFSAQAAYKELTNTAANISDPCPYRAGYHNFTQFRAYSVGFFYPFPIQSNVTIEYSQFNNGTTGQGCIQALFQIAAEQITEDPNLFRGLFNVEKCLFQGLSLLRDTDTDSTCIFVLNGILSLYDCNFLQNEREISCISNPAQYAELSLTGCVSDKTIENMVAGDLSELHLTYSPEDNSINEPDKATLDLSFDSNPTVSLIFATQSFTPSLEPTPLPTPDNIAIYSIPSNTIGIIAVVAGIVLIMYFAFTCIMRKFSDQRFSVFGGSIDDISDGGCCSWLPCCRNNQESASYSYSYSYSYSDSTDSVGFTMDDDVEKGNNYYGQIKSTNNKNGMARSNRKEESSSSSEKRQKSRAMAPTSLQHSSQEYMRLPRDGGNQRQRRGSTRRMKTTSDSD